MMGCAGHLTAGWKTDRLAIGVIATTARRRGSSRLSKVSDESHHEGSERLTRRTRLAMMNNLRPSEDVPEKD